MVLLMTINLIIEIVYLRNFKFPQVVSTNSLIYTCYQFTFVFEDKPKTESVSLRRVSIKNSISSDVILS